MTGGSKGKKTRAEELGKLIADQSRDRSPRIHQRGVSLDTPKGESKAVATDSPLPPRAKPNKDDAPHDYDAEIGRIMPLPDKSSGPTEAEYSDFARTATRVMRRLAQGSWYRDSFPIATPQEVPVRVPDELWAARQELEALHAALLPGWREIVLGWLEEHAEAKIEARFREAFEKRSAYERENKIGRTNTMPARQPMTGAELLDTLHRNPPDLMGPIPGGLTEQMLDYAAARVIRRQGQTAGATPKVLLRDIERWTTSGTFEKDAIRDARARHKRRKSRRK